MFLVSHPNCKSTRRRMNNWRNGTTTFSYLSLMIYGYNVKTHDSFETILTSWRLKFLIAVVLSIKQIISKMNQQTGSNDENSCSIVSQKCGCSHSLCSENVITSEMLKTGFSSSSRFFSHFWHLETVSVLEIISKNPNGYEVTNTKTYLKFFTTLITKKRISASANSVFCLLQFQHSWHSHLQRLKEISHIIMNGKVIMDLAALKFQDGTNSMSLPCHGSTWNCHWISQIPTNIHIALKIIASELKANEESSSWKLAILVVDVKLTMLTWHMTFFHFWTILRKDE